MFRRDETSLSGFLSWTTLFMWAFHLRSSFTTTAGAFIAGVWRPPLHSCKTSRKAVPVIQEKWGAAPVGRQNTCKWSICWLRRTSVCVPLTQTCPLLVLPALGMLQEETNEAWQPCVRISTVGFLGVFITFLTKPDIFLLGSILFWVFFPLQNVSLWKSNQKQNKICSDRRETNPNPAVLADCLHAVFGLTHGRGVSGSLLESLVHHRRLLAKKKVDGRPPGTCWKLRWWIERWNQEQTLLGPCSREKEQPWWRLLQDVPELFLSKRGLASLQTEERGVAFCQFLSVWNLFFGIL